MKRNLFKNSSIGLLLAGAIISNNSCTIMKRKYRSGYYITPPGISISKNHGKSISNNYPKFTFNDQNTILKSDNQTENPPSLHSTAFLSDKTNTINEYAFIFPDTTNKENNLIVNKNNKITYRNHHSDFGHFPTNILFEILKNRKLQDILKAERKITSYTKDKNKDRERIEKMWSDCGLNFKTVLKLVTIFGIMGAHYWYSRKYFIGCLNTFVFLGTLTGLIALFMSPAAAPIILAFYGIPNIIWWQIDVARVKDGSFKPECYYYGSSNEEKSLPPKTILYPIVISGSKADGTLKVGYEIKPEIISQTIYDQRTGSAYIVYHEKPIDMSQYEIDQNELERKVMEYCNNWGYKGYNFFESSKKECVDMDVANRVCKKYRFTHECQCTDTPNNSGQGQNNNNNTGNVDNKIKSLGTAFLISNDGYAVTNYHVIDDASNPNKIELYDTHNKISYTAKVIAKDIRNDLALLKIEDDKFGKQYLPYSISNKSPRVGEEVFVIGYPEADKLGTEPKFVDGKISALSGVQDDMSSYQLTTPVYPGNSGSPLFNKNGEIIGVINAKFKSGDNVSYAIKKTALINLLESNNVVYPSVNNLQNKSTEDKIQIIKKYVYLVIIK
ncbi:MAG: hypothetical protein Fur0023_04570 [Bacteroidia bacterium]